MLKRWICAVAVAAIAVGVFSSSAVAFGQRPTPVLGWKYSPYSKGFGAIKPRLVYLGGDVSGTVKKIHWHSWGSQRAKGWGTGFYLKPHQLTYQGHFEKGAKIVAFHLGRCHGHRAYTRVEWFWPSHGQHFRSNLYTNACNGFDHF
jgi:hypothetical protein